jgi:hypothetical protein
MPMRRAGHGPSHRPQAALDLSTLLLLTPRPYLRSSAHLDIVGSGRGSVRPVVATGLLRLEAPPHSLHPLFRWPCNLNRQ